MTDYSTGARMDLFVPYITSHFSTGLCVVATALIAYFLIRWMVCRREKRPPGPGFVQMIFVYWQLIRGKALHDIAMDLAVKYGPLTFLRLLGQDACFVNDADTARNLLQGDTRLKTSDRRVTEPIRILFYGDRSVTFGAYNEWKKNQRKLFFKAMSYSANNNDFYNKALKSEEDRLYQLLTKVQGNDINMDTMLADSFNRVVFLLLKGDLDCEESISTTTDITALLSKLAAPDISAAITVFPCLLYAPGVRHLTKAILTKRDQFLDDILPTLESPRDLEECQSFVDNLLYHTLQHPYDAITHADLRGYVFSTLTAAQLTTRAAALGLVLSLINCPEVARRIQTEIDDVIGRQRDPDLTDKKDMPYMEAVLLENFRHLSINPFVIRNASEDFDFEGYRIPQNAMILINNWFITKDSDWIEPWQFNPERFLDENGMLLPRTHQRRQKLMSFGIGLRRCPAEEFAVNNLFLRMTSLLQKFDILPPGEGRMPSNDPRLNLPGLALLPPPFKCRVLLRKLD